MIGRWEGNARVASNNWGNDSSMTYDIAPIRGGATTAEELFDRIADRLNIGEQSAATKAGILSIVNLEGSDPIADVDDDTAQDLVAYLTGHPMFQLR